MNRESNFAQYEKKNMKKITTLLTITAAIAASAVSFGQVSLRSPNWTPKPNKSTYNGNSQFQTQSFSSSLTDSSVTVLWLQDGLSNNYTAFSYPLAQVTGLGNRVEVVALGAFNSEFDRTNIWAGTGLSLRVIDTEGFRLNLYGGYKGFNLGNNFNAAQGRESWVVGLGISIPIR